MSTWSRLIFAVVLISMAGILATIAITATGTTTTHVVAPPVVGFAATYQTMRGGHVEDGFPYWTQRCGNAFDVKHKAHGQWVRHYQHCLITQEFAVVHYPQKGIKVPPTATPRPYVVPTPPPYFPPTPQVITVAPIRINTAVPTVATVSSSGVQRLLDEINAERASHGYAPLSFDAGMSYGAGTCGGAIAEANAMVSHGAIGHFLFPGDTVGCVSASAFAENVGVAAYGPENGDVDAVEQQMIGEPWSPGCEGNHHCNIDGPYTRIGIAIVAAPWMGYNAHYIAETFAS